MLDSLSPHWLQHSTFSCPSLSLGVCSNSYPLSWWCHPTISSSVIPFSCCQSFPASGSFSMSWLFLSGSKCIESQLQQQSFQWIFRWLSLGLTRFISLLSKGLSRIFSSTTVGSINSYSRDGEQRRQWHPTPVFLPGKSCGWRSLVGCSPWGR